MRLALAKGSERPRSWTGWLLLTAILLLPLGVLIAIGILWWKGRKVKWLTPIRTPLAEQAVLHDVPLGILVGWIAVESDGKTNLPKTSIGETGLFQVSADEAIKIGTEAIHDSPNAKDQVAEGGKLIAYYRARVDGWSLPGVLRGSEFYWRCVKLCHTVGEGGAKQLLDSAHAAGKASTWADFAAWVQANGSQYAGRWGFNPAQYIPHIDKLIAVGKPFGVTNLIRAEV